MTLGGPFNLWASASSSSINREQGLGEDEMRSVLKIAKCHINASPYYISDKTDLHSKFILINSDTNTLHHRPRQL